MDEADFTGFEPFELTDIKLTENRLGHGSYATVQEVEYMGLKCAGKKIHELLLEQGGRSSYTIHRFKEECRLLSQVRHPNIVQFLGVYFEQRVHAPILVMEFLPTNLTACIDEHFKFPKEIRYSILHDVALGLCYLHSQLPPIIHRDLSSNNVLLTPDVKAKISDLGVARILNLTPLQVSRMTQTPGTPAYMPPEVMIGDPKYDASIDVFSYGVLMIHVLSGRWPEPRIGQTRVDSSTRNLMPVTEAERREVYLRDIGYNHPLMDFILRCIDNDARCRAHANEIVVRLAVMVQQFPPSLCNRLEMLKCIEEKKQVVKEAEDKRRELLVKAKAVDQQNFVLCGEVEHLKLQIRNLNSEIQLLMAKNESRVSELERSDKLLKKLMNELAQLRTNYHVLEQQISTMKTRILRKGDALEKKDSEHNTTIAVLEQKCDVISGLSDQLTRAREYLSSKQQILQASIIWKQCADSPSTISESSTTVINDIIYCGGGDSDSDDGGYIVYAYDPTQDNWTALPPLPVRHFGLGQVSGKLVAVGGEKKSNNTITNEVYNYDERSKKWKHVIPPMPTARDFPGVLSLQSALVVAGGNLIVSDDYIYSDAVEVFKLGTSQWYRTDPLPIACLNISLIAVGNTCYALGGYDDSQLNQVHFASVDALLSNAVLANHTTHARSVSGSSDDAQSAWKSLESMPTFQPSAAMLADKLLAIGGREKPREGTDKKEIYMYSSRAMSWIYISDLPAPRYASAAAILSSLEIVVIGGSYHSEDMRSLYKGTLCIL